MEKFEENQNEVWRIISDNPDYEVSSLGRVRNKDKGYFLSNVANNNKGYKKICISFRNSQNGKVTMILSRLVAKAFPEICGEWFDKCEVHHLDKNPENNRVDNLVVCTRKEHDAYHRADRVERCKKLNEANKGRYAAMTDEEKKTKYGLIGENNPMWGRARTDEEKRKISMSRKDKKPVYQYTLDGQFIRKWESLKQIERELGFRGKGISGCCNGKLHHKTAYGFIWTFANQDNPD